MKQKIIGWPLIGGILILAGLLAALAGAAGLGFDLSKLSNVHYVSDTIRPEGTFSRIAVDCDVSDVKLLPAEDGTCSVSYTLQEQAEILVSVEDGCLKVTAKDQKKWYEYALNLDFTGNHSEIRIYLPQSEYENLSLRIGTGDLQVPAGFVFQTALLKSGTGEIDWQAETTQSLEVKGTTGDVNLQGSAAGAVTVKISTGEVTLTGLQGEPAVSLETSTGDVRVGDMTCAELTVKTATGEIRLDRVEAVGSLRAETSTGEIRLDHCDGGELYLTSDTGDVTGTLLTGKQFDAQSTTGDVSIPGNSEGGPCRIRTTTGDISIRIE